MPDALICPSCGRRCRAFNANMACRTIEKRKETRTRLKKDPAVKVYGVKLVSILNGHTLKIKTITDLLVGLSPSNMPIHQARRVAIGIAQAAVVDALVKYEYRRGPVGF